MDTFQPQVTPRNQLTPRHLPVVQPQRWEFEQALRIAVVAKAITYMAGFRDRNFFLCFGVLAADHGKHWGIIPVVEPKDMNH